MQLIESKTLGSAQASIEFTNIPQTFTDLYLVCSLRSDNADWIANGLIRFNGSSANFSNRSLIGAQTSVFSADYTTSRQINSVDAATSTSNTFSSHSIYIPNYTSSNAKSFSAEGATETGGSSDYNELGIMANLWNNTAAITSITIATTANKNFVQYSSVSLYGITKGSDGTTTVS